jgi:hypothetical protein
MKVSPGTAAGRLLGFPDPAGLLYGALIAASVLATGAAHGDYRFVALATGLVLGVYWLAHVYIEAQSLQLHGDARNYLHLLRHTAAQEIGVILGGVPAIGVFLASKALGASTTHAATIAVYFSVAVLFIVGYLTAHQAGRRGFPALVDSLTAAFFGVVVIVAKALLH